MRRQRTTQNAQFPSDGGKDFRYVILFLPLAKSKFVFNLCGSATAAPSPSSCYIARHMRRSELDCENIYLEKK